MKLKQIYDIIDKMAPFDTQMSFDNAGLLIGSMECDVTKIGVVLDVTPDVVQEAVSRGIDCIVSHHPIIFSALKSIGTGCAVYQAIHQGIAVISAHTNLDAANGGVNDALADLLSLQKVEPLGFYGESTPPMGRIGYLSDELDVEDFVKLVEERLHTRVRFTRGDSKINRVAVCGGAGGDLLYPAIDAGADALVTAEIKHHMFLQAQSQHFILIDAGHFETEVPVVKKLCQFLTNELNAQIDYTPISVEIIPQSSPVSFA